MSSEVPKVFCVGFNKTGTTTLHRIFAQLGLRSAHNPRWTDWSFTRNTPATLNRDGLIMRMVAAHMCQRISQRRFRIGTTEVYYRIA